MTELERIKIAVKTLISLGVANTQEGIGLLLGYTSKSAFSQVLNGKVPLPSDFIDRLSKLDDRVEKEWLKTGLGNVLSTEYKQVHNLSSQIVSEPKQKYNSNTPQVITVDKHGDDNIVLVPIKAAAGYLNGYGDPKFIQKLPTYSLPNISNGIFRMFQVGGHSMYPTLHDGAFVVGQFVEKWVNDIKDDRVYIIVSKTDGIVIKRVLNRIEKYGQLYCKSDNRREYPNFPISPEDVLEVWEFKLLVSYNLPNPADLYERINDLEAKLMYLEGKVKK